MLAQMAETGGRVMSEYQFCTAYINWRNVQEFKKNNEQYYREDAHLLYEIVVALVVRKWRKGQKNHASRMTDYRYRGCGYKLNYCPECGRDLRNDGRGEKWSITEESTTTYLTADT